MPTQPLPLKPGQGLDNNFFPECELVFYYDMNDGVELRVWQFDFLPPVVRRDQLDTLAFVGPKPIGGSRRGVRIVRIHLI